jgi:hypothetical protein
MLSICAPASFAKRYAELITFLYRIVLFRTLSVLNFESF